MQQMFCINGFYSNIWLYFPLGKKLKTVPFEIQCADG